MVLVKFDGTGCIWVGRSIIQSSVPAHCEPTDGYHVGPPPLQNVLLVSDSDASWLVSISLIQERCIHIPDICCLDRFHVL